MISTVVFMGIVRASAPAIAALADRIAALRENNMGEKKLSNFLERHIKVLVHMRQRMIRDNRLALCLGAGVSKDFQIPLWKTLIERIAAHPEVKGRELLTISESLTAQSQFLYQKYLQAIPCTEDEDDVVRAKRVHTGWLKIVHACLYEGAKTTDDDLRAHPYLAQLAPLIKKSAMTINYNFDDTVERMLYLQNKEAGVSHDDKGFEVVWQPAAQFRRNHGVIYHPNGFLPLQTIDGFSDQLVFMEQEFADQLVDVGAGHYVALLNHLAKQTVIFLGLSLSDANLKHLLRISAKANPGNFHYHIHWCRDSDLSDTERDAISKANFSIYNLVTLFLTTEEIRELATLLVASPEEFTAACDAQRNGIRTDYRYYLTGPVGSGKTATVELLKSVGTFDEWVDRRHPLLARPHSQLTAEERSEVDEWINQQFRKKNRRVSSASQMISVVDRSPLDPLYFVKDRAAASVRAAELLQWMVPSESSIQSIAPGHLIVLKCEPSVLAVRLAGRGKTYTIEQLGPQIETLRETWDGLPVTVINTTNMTQSQVVNKVLEVILFGKYEPISFHDICQAKARAPA